MWDDKSLQGRRPSSAGVSTHGNFDPLGEHDRQMLPVLTDEEVSAFFSCPDFQVGPALTPMAVLMAYIIVQVATSDFCKASLVDC